MASPTVDETEFGERVLVAFEPALFEHRGLEALEAEVSRLVPRAEIGQPRFVQLPFIAVTGADPRDVAAAVRTLRGVSAIRRVRRYELLIVFGFEAALRQRAAVEGTMEIGAPDIVFDRPGRSTAADPQGGSLVARRGRLAAVNLSLGTDDLAPYDRADAVNLATRAAARVVPVVVAAGNEGYVSNGVETMNAWAQAPWVISVAATTAADGGTRADYSSVGDLRRRSTHPTVAAYGASALDESRLGTSFAAPRVARQLSLLGSFTETLRTTAMTFEDGVREAPPLPWVYLVDCRITRRWERKWEYGVLPRGGVDRDALERAMRLLEGAGAEVDLEPTPRRLKSMLVRSAQRIPRCSRRYVGAGFVSDETTSSYLGRFTGEELATIFAPDRAQLSYEVIARLRSLRLTVADELGELQSVWQRAQVVDGFDVGACEGELGLHRRETVLQG